MLVILAGIVLLWLAYATSGAVSVEMTKPIPEPVPEIPAPPKPWGSSHHGRRS